jgi:hypothetical protein
MMKNKRGKNFEAFALSYWLGNKPSQYDQTHTGYVLGHLYVNKAEQKASS